MIRYEDHALLDKIVPLAAQAGIFDLIKVDYITEDLDAVRVKMTAYLESSREFCCCLLPFPDLGLYADRLTTYVGGDVVFDGKSLAIGRERALRSAK